MKVAIYGLGYVGLTAAACLTREGHHVLGVDVSNEKVAQINSGISPITEPGLEDLLRKALDLKLLYCTTNGDAELGSCSMAIVCVGTPSGSDGSHNMRYIADVSRQIANSLKGQRDVPLVVVYRSTIRPGSIEELIGPIFRNVLGDAVKNVELVYNPEFLRESVAINDYFNPPKIVIGTHDGKPCALMDELNKNLEAPLFYTGYREAEFTKFVDNTFHAVKISFANEIGRVAVQLGIDPKIVHKIFVSDTKLNISPYYFRPGGAFGGSCLPKDVRALQYISADVGANSHLVDSLIRSNEAHKHFLFQLATRGLQPGAKVLMLGIAFKSNSDDLRESPNVDLARKIMQAGFKLSVYDPALEPKKLIGQNLGYAFSHLPQIEGLLIARDAAETGDFDAVIDTQGTAKTLQLRSTNIVDVHAL
jgi:GDP-mannose 6-dehydrogenase